MAKPSKNPDGTLNMMLWDCCMYLLHIHFVMPESMQSFGSWDVGLVCLCINLLYKWEAFCFVYPIKSHAHIQRN